MPPLLDRTMSAVRKLQSAPGLSLCQEVPLPRIGPRDVLISVTCAGICGTDRHIFEWDAWSQSRVKVGITVGHEFVGRVAAVGDDVRRIQIGQRVSAEGHIGCGRCEPCRTGNGHICEKVDILGIDRDGAFAQYVSVPEDNVWTVHDDIPDHIAAIFDPLGNAVHTVMAAGVSGRSVLITGVGMIGLMAVTVARAAGAGQILVSDMNPEHLELARRLGADQAYLASDDDWPHQARRATGDQGPNVLLEMSGHQSAIKQGFFTLRNGGTAALLGLPSGPITFDLPSDIIFKGATVLGINGRRMFETWYQMENLVLSGRLDLEPVITHRIELADFEKGFRWMQSGQALKVIMNITHEDGAACQARLSSSDATNG